MIEVETEILHGRAAGYAVAEGSPEHELQEAVREYIKRYPKRGKLTFSEVKNLGGGRHRVRWAYEYKGGCGESESISFL